MHGLQEPEASAAGGSSKSGESARLSAQESIAGAAGFSVGLREWPLRRQVLQPPDLDQAGKWEVLRILRIRPPGCLSIRQERRHVVR